MSEPDARGARSRDHQVLRRGRRSRRRRPRRARRPGARLVGPNGAGKTTLLGLLLGLSAADRGRWRSSARPCAAGRRLPDGVAGFVDGPGLYPSLTARQNLAALASLRGRARAPAIDEALEQVGLTDVADDRVRGFSLGMRQRLGLAAALLIQPRLLVLDEPANGLDPAGTRHVHRVLTELAADGTAVVLSSHRMDELAARVRRGHPARGRADGVLRAGRPSWPPRAAQLDHRLRTSDAAAAAAGRAARRRRCACWPATTRSAAADAEALSCAGRSRPWTTWSRGWLPAGVAVRELAPVVPPLEAAYLALTGGRERARRR